MHESYRNSLPLHSIGAEEDRSGLENNGPSRGSYDSLTVEGTNDLKMKLLIGFLIEYYRILVSKGWLI